MTGILVDENVPNNVREWLKKKGFDIVNVSETSLKRAKDYAIAEYAAKNNMTILTRQISPKYITRLRKARFQ